MMLLRRLNGRIPNHKEHQLHPLSNFLKIAIAWNNLTAVIDWQAPKGLYWTCGEWAYTILPNDSFRSCVLGTIQPCLLLFCHRWGEKLGVFIYEERINRKKWDALQIGDSKEDQWPPEQIIQYYCPATWAEVGSWGSHTQICMLKHIIWLQSVFEIITNETVKALNILAKKKN
jgi:hypothetical protein